MLRVRDLEKQKLILPTGQGIEFPIDEFARRCLLGGVDELGNVLQQEVAIAAYEAEGGSTLNTLRLTANIDGTLSASTCGRSVKQTFNADVLIKFRPVDCLTGSNETKVLPLGRGSFG